MISVYVLAGAALVLVIAVFRTLVRSAELSRLTWDDLISKLQPAETAGITLVAVEYLTPAESSLWTGPDERWTMIGGREGLRRMRANADLLIAIAGRAQDCNFVESLTAVERMRQDGLSLRHAATRITLGMLFGYGRARSASYVQEAASAYYLMTQRLMSLYETTQPGRYTRLSAALWQYDKPMLTAA